MNKISLSATVWTKQRHNIMDVHFCTILCRTRGVERHGEIRSTVRDFN